MNAAPFPAYIVAWKGGFDVLKWLLGAAGALLLLWAPEAAANGAREAMAQWYHAVAPTLFPFMALTPLLTCAEAASVYERPLGGFMRGVFRMPGAAAPALAAGMLAGSPAGTMIARRTAANAGMSRGQLQRLAIACAGLSPAFLISGVGARLLGDARLGHVLLKSQLGAQLLTPLALTPFLRDVSPVDVGEEGAGTSPVLSILNVCGFMALFGALTAAFGSLTSARVGRWCLLGLDINAGARIVAEGALPPRIKLIALSALTGFGGLCVGMQNLHVLKGIMSPFCFFAGRLLVSCLAAGLTALQTANLSIKYSLNPLQCSCLCACALLVPVIFRLKRTVD